MATKIFKSGNYIIIDDGVVVKQIPTKNCRYSVSGTSYTIRDDQQDLFSVVEPFSNITDEAGSAYSSESVFVTFLRSNTGFNSGGASSLPTGEIFNGGFVDYNDSTTAGTPISLSAGVPTVLTNDGAGSFTNKTYLPTGVTDVWDEVDSFDWSELELGDMLDIRMDVFLTTSSPNTTVEVDLHLGTGGGAYTIPFVTDADFKDAGTHTINKYNGIYMGDTNTLNNGGQFKITCDKNSTVVVNGWYVKIIRRG
jgi:hypothetical protein